VLCLGVIQSLFEGSMYTFVLEWTPALTPAGYLHHTEVSHSTAHHGLVTLTSVDNTDDADEDGHRGAIPHGYIFAAFMVEFVVSL